jgi:hypothetical protein
MRHMGWVCAWHTARRTAAHATWHTRSARTPPARAQVQSNALGALEAIDPEIADEIMAEGCITGDRINGLCDGVTGDW